MKPIVTFLSMLFAFAAVSEVQAQRYINLHSQEDNHNNLISFSSPAAHAFAEYVVNPVGHYTGIPQISIPLHTIALKDFSLPVSLSYHAGGIKVDETASNVGLGWTLAAGGVITRSVKDRADDASIDFCQNLWILTQGASKPPIAEYTTCGNGLLWALDEPSNANYDGLPSYNIDITAYNGLLNSSTSSMKLIKMFYGVSKFTGSGPASDNIYLMNMADKEPDIFYFNFAGRTGKFVFDMNSGTPVVRTLPYQDLKIEHFTNEQKKLSSFKITDEKGVVYIFSEVEVSTSNYAANQVPNADDLYMGPNFSYRVSYYETGTGSTKYTSSWFLSRIETPMGDYLDFTYEGEAYKITTRGPQQTGFFYMNPPAGANTYNPNDLTYESGVHNKGFYNCLKTNDMVIHGKRLKKIENNTIKIDFPATEQRQDLVVENATINGIAVAGAYAVGEMVVYNKIGGEQRIKKIKFNTDYFNSSPWEYINKFYTLSPDNYDITVTDSLRYFKRLRLRSVQEFGKDDNSFQPPYTFEYKDYDFTAVSSHRLPHRLTYQQDMWGYYNGASGNNTLIPGIYVYPNHYPVKDNRQFRVYKKTSFTGAEYYLPGANRLPNTNFSDIGMLTRVIYPSKGYTEYQFQPHTFKNEGEEYTGGGLRIKKIIKHDGFNPSSNIVYDYTYVNEDNTSSGCVVSLPVMASRNFFNIFNIDQNSELAYRTYTIRYSTPLASLGTTNGSFVGYRRVTESIQGNGKTVYTFSMPAAWYVENDIPITTAGGVCDPAIDGHCDGLYQLTPVSDLFLSAVSANLNPANYNFSHNPAAPNTMPFPENPNYDWQRGHLLNEKIYDNSNALLKEIVYTWGNYFPDNLSAPVNVYGYKFSHHYALLNTNLFPAAHVFRMAKYKMLTDVAKVLESKTEIISSTENPGIKATSIATFAYENVKLNQATLTTATDSQGKTIKNISQFPNDLPGELGSDLLLSKHMHHIPLRQTIRIDDVPTGKTEVGFQASNGKVVPGTITEYGNGTTATTKVLHAYNSDGNLQQTTPIYKEDASGTVVLSGIPSAYLWGYEGTLPIAKIENAKISDVFYTGFEDASGNSVNDDCRTGHKSKTNGFNRSLTGLTNGPYTLSFWEKSGTSWILQQQAITVSGGSYTIDIASTRQVDDIRFYPSVARMFTYTYDPGAGMTSSTDANNIAAFYEYDKMNRLHLVRDDKRNIVKELDYNFKQ